MMSSKWVIKDKFTGLFFMGFEQDEDSGEQVSTWTADASKVCIFNREVDAWACLSINELYEEAEVVPYDETN